MATDVTIVWASELLGRYCAVGEQQSERELAVRGYRSGIRTRFEARHAPFQGDALLLPLPELQHDWVFTSATRVGVHTEWRN